MRSFLTYGLISLVGVGALYACGDDSGDGTTAQGGSGGQGGTAGAGGGGAGMAGSAGQGAGAGQGGGGSGGAPAIDVTPIATCVGCAELIVPVSGANSAMNVADQAIFQFGFAAPGADFTNGVATWKVMALANNDNMFVNTFAQNGPPDGYIGVYPTYRNLTAAAFPPNTWVDIVLDISAYRAVGGAGDAGADAAADAGDAGGGIDPMNAFNKARVQALGIQLGATPMFTGTGTARLAIDSVTITGVPGQTSKTFDTTNDGLASNPFELPPNTPAPVHH